MKKEFIKQIKIFLLGYYSRHSLRRHIKRCYFNNETTLTSRRPRHQAQAQNLLVVAFGPNDPLRTSGLLNSLAADDVSLVAKKDKIICEVGRKYITSHKEKHLVPVARRQMRRLARLLIESRKIEKYDSLSFLSFLHPSKFKTIVNATHAIAKYNSETNLFGSPSLALQMGTLLKKAVAVAYSFEIQKDVDSKLIKILDAMKNLINEQWASEVSTRAGQNMQINRFNKPTLIPMAEDIAVSIKLFNYTLSKQNPKKIEMLPLKINLFRLVFQFNFKFYKKILDYYE